MSAFMIATITVKDPAKFQTYLAETQKVAAPYGAKLLLRGMADKVLTGETADHGMVVIVEFPSLEKIDQWYASDAYRPLIPLRDAGSDMTITSYQVIE
ncbi:MAG: DUF1330 domain-containing protein [Alphaproteobacteria bacterium]|nr:DUF1330 domain-containing protein [Alphaproteobacteria bacterium]